MKLKILVIGFVWPEPNSTGAGKRIMEMLQLFLEQRWEVIFASAAKRTELSIDLGSMGIHTAEISLNDVSFDAWINKISPDFVLFDRFMSEEQFGWRVEKECPTAIRIVETIDLHLLRHARQQAHSSGSELKHGDLFNEIAKREIASIYRSDLSLLISSFEHQLLRQQFDVPESLVHVTPFMIDDKTIDHAPRSFGQRSDFVLIGNFRHPPNLDSVHWLKTEIWPLIRQEIPDAQLNIYGAYPTKAVMALHQPAAGFHLHGWTPDALAVIREARIMLAPLRFGAGIKGKIADAMVTGTPIVTTSVGAESMYDGHSWPGRIADDAGTFARQAIELYEDEARWTEKQMLCFKIVSELFNRKRNGRILIERLLTLREEITTHRLDNFTGAMLRHHHHRSSEYMSRWIEAKNSRD